MDPGRHGRRMRARVSQVRALTDGKEAGGGHLNSCLGRVGYKEAESESGQGERTKDQARGGMGRQRSLTL